MIFFSLVERPSKQNIYRPKIYSIFLLNLIIFTALKIKTIHMQLWIMGTYKFGLYLILFCKMQPWPSVVVWLANLKVNKETIFDTCWHLRHSSVLSLTHVCNAIFHCNVIFISKGYALFNENDFINWKTTYECNQIKDIDTFANEQQKSPPSSCRHGAKRHILEQCTW